MARSLGKKTSDMAVWIILILLIIGLGGFGISNFGGSVRSIGSVGDEPISVDDYARALQSEIAAQQQRSGAPFSFAQAQQSGLTGAIQRTVIDRATLDNETGDLGLSVGDEEVRREVLQVSAFQGIDGQFDREAYRATLQRAGQTEAQFEAQLRKDVARNLLQGAVLTGVATPDAYTGALYSYFAERRSYTLIEVTEDTLEAPVGTPDDAALQAFYEANPAAFTTPETLDITYAWLTPDMIVDTVEVEEDALRALYDERIADYQQPERRLVERLVFATTEDAAAAKARLDADEITFEDLVAERGLALSDIDLGDVAATDLGAAGAAVFALDGPGVTEPQDTDLGPALFRMNAILAARDVPFDEARGELQAEAALDKARRVISDMMGDVDDRLAAGATLEELTDETELRLDQIAWHPDLGDGIAGYEAFRDAAAAAQPGDFPELVELDDGGIFAMRLNEIVAPALQALADMRDTAIEGWQQQELTRALTERAEALKAQLDGGADLATLEVDHETMTDLTRGAVTPQALSDPLFALDPGDSTIVTDSGRIYLARLDAVSPPDDDDPISQFLQQQIEQQTAQALSQDVLDYYVQYLRQNAGLTLDQAAINAVHAQFQ
ncbi:peptidylprolyl isomerase [Actibacterium ureilyticum]|uniref:peptidylprolyl isomerase n=1 Tax=Actibacterium ureilyticum TaxID=1590614 RepID=UPI000BAAB66D|nr:peptidylprolyl isomerase [Actibacterium ureilyticum]